MRANGFERSKRLHGRALAELRSAFATNDRDGIRQAAEKGWLAVVEATKALLRTHVGSVPGDTSRQRDVLHRLGRRVRQAKPLYDLFRTSRETLHISCFYDDGFVPSLVEESLREEVGTFIDLAQRVAANRPR